MSANSQNYIGQVPDAARDTNDDNEAIQVFPQPYEPEDESGDYYPEREGSLHSDISWIASSSLIHEIVHVNVESFTEDRENETERELTIIITDPAADSSGRTSTIPPNISTNDTNRVTSETLPEVGFSTNAFIHPNFDYEFPNVGWYGTNATSDTDDSDSEDSIYSKYSDTDGSCCTSPDIIGDRVGFRRLWREIADAIYLQIVSQDTH
ncbi:hypothetical protein JCM33374_g5474 [Metschnikowia sp. JCM 33374]|nr:hypothetical protein JCM33374_g5474 [Metschnikowia sp. JCM 33374]